MTNIKNIVLSILMLAAFTKSTHGALYTVENKGSDPITVKLDLAGTTWRGPDTILNETLTAKDLKPGETTKLNAGGGKNAYIIYLIKPGSGTRLPMIPLGNVRYMPQPDLQGKYYNPDLKGDKTIEFTSKGNSWFINVH